MLANSVYVYTLVDAEGGNREQAKRFLNDLICQERIQDKKTPDSS